MEPVRDGAVESEVGAVYPIRRLLGDLVRFARPYPKIAGLSLAALVGSELAGLYPPWALGTMITFLADREPGESQRLFWLLLAGWAVLGSGHFLLREVAHHLGFQLAQRVALEARLAVLGRLLTRDLAWHGTEASGNRLKRIANGEDGLNHVVRMLYTHVLPGGVALAGVTVILSTLSPALSLAVALWSVSYFVLSYRVTQRVAREVQKVNRQEEAVEGIAYQALSNVLTIKALDIHRPVLARLRERIERLMIAVRRRIFFFRVREALSSQYATLFRLGTLAVIAAGIFRGELEVGLLVMFTAYFDRVWKATGDMSFVSNETLVRSVSVGRMMNMLDEPAGGAPAAAGERPMPSDWRSLRLAGVSFAHGGKTVLSDVDLVLRRGERVGVVGPSGAGKTTLLRLLLKLHEDYRGEILVDDVPLRRIDRASYLERVAVVLQETEVFDLTLAENIEIAAEPEARHSPEARRRLERALAAANLEELVAALPEGADTPIGERGLRLSGGEKQRLGLARAIYKEPDLLLLDEATSNLDAHSEALIQESLEGLFEQVTAVVVAHRLATVRQMDRILVLDGGRILEQGTFAELIARRGPFYELWREQSLELPDPAVQGTKLA